jgi:hypothetical protein
LRVKDQRFKVRGGGGGRGGGGVLLQRYQIFVNRSRESSWVIDSIFELKSMQEKLLISSEELLEDILGEQEKRS